MNSLSTRTRSTQGSISPKSRMSRWGSFVALCLVLVGAMAPGSVRADDPAPPMVHGHCYVHYTYNHILSATGPISELLGTTTDSDGHVMDFYGNRVIFNTDSTIADINNTVVGFVY